GADLCGDPVDRVRGRFEQVVSVADAGATQPLQRRSAGLLTEAAVQGCDGSSGRRRGRYQPQLLGRGIEDPAQQLRVGRPGVVDAPAKPWRAARGPTNPQG